LPSGEGDGQGFLKPRKIPVALTAAIDTSTKTRKKRMRFGIAEFVRQTALRIKGDVAGYRQGIRRDRLLCCRPVERALEPLD